MLQNVVLIVLVAVAAKAPFRKVVVTGFHLAEIVGTRFGESLVDVPLLPAADVVQRSVLSSDVVAGFVQVFAAVFLRQMTAVDLATVVGAFGYVVTVLVVDIPLSSAVAVDN